MQCAIGAEFLRWEIATATAGLLMGINPFDEPNVKQAKDATNALLEKYRSTGTLPGPEPHGEIERVRLTLSTAAEQELHGAGPEHFLRVLARRRLLRAARVPAAGSRAVRLRAAGYSHRSRQGQRLRDDVRVRAAISPLHRPAAQGRRQQRRLRHRHGRGAGGSADSRSVVFVWCAGDGAGAWRFRIARSRPAAARCTCICRGVMSIC